MIHDISPAISERLRVCPVDTPPAREILSDVRRHDPDHPLSVSVLDEVCWQCSS